VSEVSLGRVGIVLGLEVSRLARNSSDWHRLLELCAFTGQGGQRGRLLRLTAMCVRAGCRRWARGGPEMSFYNPLFDLIREVAWRLAGAYSAVVAPPSRSVHGRE
jgi:hypothetical protein